MSFIENSSIFDRFLKIHSSLISKEMEIQFDTGWHNGTGYMDNAVQAKLTYDEPRAGIDNLDREFIIIPTKLGNVIVFKRNSIGQKLVMNCSKELGSLLRVDNSFSEFEEVLIFGGNTMYFFKHANIGARLKDIDVKM